MEESRNKNAGSSFSTNTTCVHVRVMFSHTHTHTHIVSLALLLYLLIAFLTVWLKCGGIRKCVDACARRHYSPAAEKLLLFYSMLAVSSGLCVWPHCHGDRPCRRALGHPVSISTGQGEAGNQRKKKCQIVRDRHRFSNFHPTPQAFSLFFPLYSLYSHLN